MDREKELKQMVGEDIMLSQLVEEIIFIEKNLTELKKLPFIKVNPKNVEQQKVTQAGKQYKELLQQYTNCIKVLEKRVKNEDGEEESPLRKWVKSRADKEKQNMDTR